MTVKELGLRMDSMEMTMWVCHDEIQAAERQKMQRMADQGMKPRGFSGMIRRGRRG